jgi:hypothetical protein
MLDAVDAAGLRAALHPLAKPVTTTDEAGRRCHEVRSLASGSSTR